MNIRSIAAATALVLCVACQPSPVDHKARGAELLEPFKGELKAALMTGMESGPVEAIAACSIEARQIAADLSVQGVDMGRSSHRLRNPVNAAPEWLAPVLRGFADGSANLEPVALAIEDGRMGYAEPIIVQPMCLVCHGEALAAPVAAKIAERYPQDRATGFNAGDFRGVFWVEFPER